MRVWESVPAIVAGCDFVCSSEGLRGGFVGLCGTVTGGVSICGCIVKCVCERVGQGNSSVTVWIM